MCKILFKAEWRCNDRSCIHTVRLAREPSQLHFRYLCFSCLLGTWRHYSTNKHTQIHSVQSLIASLNPCLTPFPCVPNLSRLMVTGTAELEQSCLYSFYLSEDASTQRVRNSSPVLIRKEDKCNPNPKICTTQLLYMKHSRWKQVWVRGEE